MSRYFARIALFTLGLAQLACGFPFSTDAITGSGHPITETRAVAGFDEIVLTGSGDADVIFGEAESLVIEADDNLITLITSEVRGRQLILGWKSDTRVSVTGPIRFTITLPTLKAVEIAGSGSVTIPPQTVERLTLTITGSGSITAAGTVDTLTARTVGSGTIDAGAVQARAASADLPGSGAITVWATEALDAQIAGSGTVSYYGQPLVVREKVSGSGDVVKLGDK